MKKFLAIIFVLLGACASHPPLDLVEKVDLERYIGRWYEIARLPHRFQEGCLQSQADYHRNEDGTIRVLNSCMTKDGEKSAKGLAKVVKNTGNAQLKVSFFRPFWGDYQIIALDKDYQSAMVGAPDRKYLWILSRIPDLDNATLNRYLEKARNQGFNIGELVYDNEK